jgi:hypothetical protein
MAQFISAPLQRILAMANAGQIVAGNIYYANDQQPPQTFISATDGSLIPMSSIILSGNITGEPGPQGPAGADGANGLTAGEVAALAIALG